MKNDSLERWSVSGTDEGEFNILRQNIEELVFGEFPSLEEDLGRWDLDDRGGGEE